MIGLVERKTNKILLYAVHKRDASTLQGIIERNVKIGSRIHTELWSAYGKVNEIGKNNIALMTFN